MNKSTVLKLILMLSLSLLLFSTCGDDDPTGPATNELVGTWKFDKVTTYYGSISTPDSTEVFASSSDFQITLTIKADNTWSIAAVFFGVTDNSSGTWSVSGNKLTIKETGEPDETSEYSVSGNKLTITESVTIDSYTIFNVVEYTKQ